MCNRLTLTKGSILSFMKRTVIVILGGLIVGLAAFASVFLSGLSNSRAIARSEAPALAWMKQEYHLNDAEFSRVCALHEAYLPTCKKMCARIAEKNAHLAELLAKTNSVTPEIRSVLAEAAQLRAECQANMLEHFYAVARTMPDDQGKKYLTWIKQQTFQTEPTSGTVGASSHHMQ